MDANQNLQDKINQDEIILKPAEVMMGGIKTTFEQAEKIITKEQEQERRIEHLELMLIEKDKRIKYLEEKIRECVPLVYDAKTLEEWFDSIEGI